MSWSPMPLLVCQCGQKMCPCWAYNDERQTMKLTHWYCDSCGHDCKAIGRERVYSDRMDGNELLQKRPLE